MGATQFGLLLWLPTYLEKAGFKEFEGYILISFGVFSLIGGSVIGVIYEKTNNRIVHLVVHLILLLIGEGILLIVYLTNASENKWMMLGLFGVSRLCLGATFNIYEAHELII